MSGPESEKNRFSRQPRSTTPMVQRLLDAPHFPAFIVELITTQATTVFGTEAAGFLIEGGQGEPGLRLIGHIRPDHTTAEIREAAIQAFQNLIKPCVAEKKDEAIELSRADNDEQPDPQYCLVTLLRNEEMAVAVSAVISRCKDLDQAKQRLQSMQLLAGYFALYRLGQGSPSTGAISSDVSGALPPVTRAPSLKAGIVMFTGLALQYFIFSGWMWLVRRESPAPKWLIFGLPWLSLPPLWLAMYYALKPTPRKRG